MRTTTWGPSRPSPPAARTTTCAPTRPPGAGCLTAVSICRKVEGWELRALLAGRDPRDDSPPVRDPAGGRARTPGFDLAFSAPKSVSLMFALGDTEQRQAAIAAHERAVGAAIGYLEQHAAFLRRGRNGVERVQVLGLVAAAAVALGAAGLAPCLVTFRQDPLGFGGAGVLARPDPQRRLPGDPHRLPRSGRARLGGRAPETGLAGDGPDLTGRGGHRRPRLRPHRWGAAARSQIGPRRRPPRRAPRRRRARSPYPMCGQSC